MLLMIDTCTQFCSVGLMGHHQGAFMQDSLVTEIGAGHAELLPGLINQILTKHALTTADLISLMVNVGPGSFAGVRVGVATARGLSLALNIPIYSYNGFEAYGMKALSEGLVTAGNTISVLWDAKREEVYAQSFHLSDMNYPCEISAMSPPEILSHKDLPNYLDQIKPEKVLGTGAALVTDQQTFPCALINQAPITTWMVESADEELMARWLEKASWHPSPLYIRPPDAKPSVKLWEALSFDD